MIECLFPINYWLTFLLFCCVFCCLALVQNLFSKNNFIFYFHCNYIMCMRFGFKTKQNKTKQQITTLANEIQHILVVSLLSRSSSFYHIFSDCMLLFLQSNLPFHLQSGAFGMWLCRAFFVIAIIFDRFNFVLCTFRKLRIWYDERMSILFIVYLYCNIPICFLLSHLFRTKCLRVFFPFIFFIFISILHFRRPEIEPFVQFVLFVLNRKKYF